ncbi:SMC-Scp complex subunit ScpB [Gammaproteobacteria bacterium]|nr:SMC-Scp complex subunit ScpB [Gammaproteobacteria bacterium]MDA7844730.1 SMC-Scp complex subunit ScpB [Gammaproteobacteria bacterium]
MALINCEECGHKISTSAESCPQCGYKDYHIRELERELDDIREFDNWTFNSIAQPFLLYVILYRPIFLNDSYYELMLFVPFLYVWFLIAYGMAGRGFFKKFFYSGSFHHLRISVLVILIWYLQVFINLFWFGYSFEISNWIDLLSDPIFAFSIFGSSIALPLIAFNLKASVLDKMLNYDIKGYETNGHFYHSEMNSLWLPILKVISVSSISWFLLREISIYLSDEMWDSLYDYFNVVLIVLSVCMAGVLYTIVEYFIMAYFRNMERETIMIIAYKQPLTYFDIETIKGIPFDVRIVDNLIVKGWINNNTYEDESYMYSTTQRLLDDLSIKSISDIKDLHEFSKTKHPNKD